MPNINVYLPDDLASQVRAAGIGISRVTQKALRAEVERRRAQRLVGVDLTEIRNRSTLLTDGALEGQAYIDALDASAADVPELLNKIVEVVAENNRLRNNLPDDVLVRPEPTEPEGS